MTEYNEAQDLAYIPLHEAREDMKDAASLRPHVTKLTIRCAGLTLEDQTMSKPKRVDADLLIRQYYEGKDTGDEGAYPEDTLESVPHISDMATPDATLSAGDIEASRSGTDTGEEAVGGSTPTPDQDVVEELGQALGITYEDAEPLRFGDKLADRDAQRWELNPASSEEYQDRLRRLSGADEPTAQEPSSVRRSTRSGKTVTGTSDPDEKAPTQKSRRKRLPRSS